MSEVAEVKFSATLETVKTLRDGGYSVQLSIPASEAEAIAELIKWKANQRVYAVWVTPLDDNATFP